MDDGGARGHRALDREHPRPARQLVKKAGQSAGLAAGFGWRGGVV